MRFLHALLCAAAIVLLSYTPPSTAQVVCKRMPTPSCNQYSRFRSLSGVCNNLRRPFLGAAETPFRRLVRPDYADGRSEPRKSRRPLGQLVPLPNARNVSLALFEDIATRSATLTHMAMVFGQFMAHDLTLAGQPEEVECDGSCRHVDECFGIRANKAGDPAFPGLDGTDCIILRRNRPCTDDVPRQQVNILSSYIDASHIYGVKDEEVDDVRDLSTDAGLLRTMPQADNSLLDLLPRANPHTPCRTSDSQNRPCFLTGDFRRNNENQGLNVMHTIWVREHNRIAVELRRINPSWSGERLFQETRRIIGAFMQHITYKEFLPGILGNTRVNDDRSGLGLLSSGRFAYDETCDPSVPNSLAAAVLRFGHSTIRNEFSRRREGGSRFRAIPVKEFLNPEFLYEIENGGIDSILRGLARDEANDIDGFFAKAILEYHLGEGGPNGPSRGDLIAINVQRGREHGLPGYNYFRPLAGLSQVQRFADCVDTIPEQVVSRLQRVYGNRVNDIDLFVGGILETPQGGSRVGPTFASILVETFRNVRCGDRFWYETGQRETRFTSEQLRQLRKASLARIICDNGDDIHQIQPKVLLQPRRSNPITSCGSLPFVDLRAWRV